MGKGRGGAVGTKFKTTLGEFDKSRKPKARARRPPKPGPARPLVCPRAWRPLCRSPPPAGCPPVLPALVCVAATVSAVATTTLTFASPPPTPSSSIPPPLPGLPVGAVVNCADNTGAKSLEIISVSGIKGRLNRLPSATVGDLVMASCKKGKPELRKKVHPAVIVRQRKTWRRKEGAFIYFEDNAGVIVNNKGEMKGSAVAGPVAKECADLWPRIASNAGSIL